MVKIALYLPTSKSFISLATGLFYLCDPSLDVGLVPELDGRHSADGERDDERQRVGRQKLLHGLRHRDVTRDATIEDLVTK